jgi:hypothetical protein
MPSRFVSMVCTVGMSPERMVETELERTRNIMLYPVSNELQPVNSAAIESVTVVGSLASVIFKVYQPLIGGF